eukprot:CAMPEP_0172521964 /NCGR_PEP_ID=MMETSP1066-20121228/292871_1 /TAXON_ID=671091 /ORGANISM="Coscinodiscus wailesii, Strain CCMP2513" /LENGTH=302 /DNA_ID=CAMNT_0013304929 /DNA_START=135 /DNA_END=1043 /DNA_ORIENTATION=+
MSTSSLNQILLNTVCPALGVIMANAVFTAPIKSLKSAMSYGSLGDLNPLPWAFMTGNCIGWVAYAYLIQNPYVFLANAPGVIISLWLNAGAIKLQYCTQLGENRKREEESSNEYPNQKSLTRQEMALYSILVLWIVVFTAVAFHPEHPQEQKVLTVGIVVNLNLVVFFGAPLSSIATVLRSRDSSSVHRETMIFFGAPLSSIATVLRSRDSSSVHRETMIMSVLNCSFWFIYGLAVMDVFIYVPNGAGLILSLIQAALYLGCPRNKPMEAGFGVVGTEEAIRKDGLEIGELEEGVGGLMARR